METENNKAIGLVHDFLKTRGLTGVASMLTSELAQHSGRMVSENTPNIVMNTLAAF